MKRDFDVTRTQRRDERFFSKQLAYRHQSTGQCDFVLANPPFNVNAVDKERLTGDIGKNRRFAFGLPRTDNANYLWIQLFYSALHDKGRAGFIMANSASDARSSEQEIRRRPIEDRGVDVMIAVGPNMFYTVALPCTLWFLDKGKTAASRETVLFVDARHIYRQIDRAHRDWTPAQIGDFSKLHFQALQNVINRQKKKSEKEDGSGTND